METLSGCSEIVEAKEESSAVPRVNEKVRKRNMSGQGRVYSIEDDINRLFDSVSFKSSAKAEALCKNPKNQPIRANYSPTSGSGFSDSVNLKQALRRLCISQASELAAIKKRSLKPGGSFGISDVRAINQLQKRVVVNDKESNLTANKGKNKVIEISFPDKIMANPSDTKPAFLEDSASSSQISHPSTSAGTSSTKIIGVPSKNKTMPLAPETMIGKSNEELVQKRSHRSTQSSCDMVAAQNAFEMEDLVSTQADSETCLSGLGIVSKVKDTRSSSPCRMNPIFRRKNFEKGKVKMESASSPCISVDTSLSWSIKSANLLKKASKVSSKHDSKTTDKISVPQNSEITEISRVADARLMELFGSRVTDVTSMVVAKANERPRTMEKGDFSQSSKSSMGEFRSSTSEESSASGYSRCCNRSRMSIDMQWEAIDSVQKQYGFLSLSHFKLLRRLGVGDIGTVYLAELVGTNCLFALKAMDNRFLAQKQKSGRAQTEKEILQMLDHPFLPVVYAYFTTDKLSCLVMDYCPGGDLHVIRQKQTSGCFSEQAARFYVAEVLLALEYLHMLGIVYRDLKPENVLVREDGHIMLTDFDSSLRCVVNPTLLRSSSPTIEPTKKSSSALCSESSCMDPFCLQPSWQLSCFSPTLQTSTSKTHKLKFDHAALVNSLPQLVAEPTDVRSHSFVGTHEYLAPEIVKGDGHGSAVDWWAYGIFLYELLYGKTPFKGSTDDETLANVVSQPLVFPETPLVSFHAKDLIRGLLMKQPENRLGFVKGAVEVKQHPFFRGLNWALIRCAVPPYQPSSTKDENLYMGLHNNEHIKFDQF